MATPKTNEQQAADPFADLMLDENEDALFDFKPFDASEGRAVLIKNAARSLKQVNKEVNVRGPVDWTIGHEGRLRYRPVLNGHAIKIVAGDKDYFPTTTNQFGTVIEKFTAKVEAGGYDDQIEAAYEGQRASTSTAKSSTGSGRTRDFGKTSLISSKINGLMRKPGRTDAEVREELAKEGYSEADIDAAYKQRADNKAKRDKKAAKAK